MDKNSKKSGKRYKHNKKKIKNRRLHLSGAQKTQMERFGILCERKVQTGYYRFKRSITSFFKWGIASVITGIVCGIFGVIFHSFVADATGYREQYPWLIYFLPFAGLVIVMIYRMSAMAYDGGTNTIINSIRSNEKIPFAMTPLIFVSTVLTHLFGGSSGREGAALQIGGSTGYSIGRALRLEENELQVVTMCGMSGVFAALFGTPVTATIFSMEVISVGVIYYVALVPCLISALFGYAIASSFGIQPVSFVLNDIPKFNLVSMLQVIALAAVCALVSIIFCIVMHQTGHIYQSKIKNQYLRIFVGGCLVVVLTLIVGCRDYNGAGMDIITNAIYGNAKMEAPFLKIIFTALTLGAGYKGGEIVPTLFIGATFGNLMGNALGLDPCFGAAIGMVALFCGVVNCPIASLILSIELFGVEGILFFCMASAVSYMLSGYYGLYSSQKIMYSKLRPHYININTK